VISARSGLPAAEAAAQLIEDREVAAVLSPHLSGLLSDLYDRLQQNSRGISTDEVIEVFGRRLRNDQEKYTFRQLLRDIADLTYTGEGRKREGRWRLKKETKSSTKKE